MTDRIRTLSVVLEQDFRDDDVQCVVDAIHMIRGVGKVEIGKVVDAKPTNKGLFVKAVIAQGTQASEEAWNLIEQGVVTAFSIGGKVLEAQREKLDDGRSVNKITKLNWAETSVVDSPANRSTMFEVLSKSVDPALDELEEPEEEVPVEAVKQKENLKPKKSTLEEKVWKKIKQNMNKNPKKK